MNLDAVAVPAPLPQGAKPADPPDDKSLAALVDPTLPADVLTLNKLVVREVELARLLSDSLRRIAEQLPVVENNAKLCLATARAMKQVSSVQDAVTARVRRLLQASGSLRLMRGFRVDGTDLSR